MIKSRYTPLLHQSVAEFIVMLFCLPFSSPFRSGPVLHQDAGGGEPRAPGGGADAAFPAHGRELGPDGHAQDVAL